MKSSPAANPQLLSTWAEHGVDGLLVRLLKNSEVPDGGSFQTFRYSIVGSVLFGALFLTAIGFFGFHLFRVGLEAPPLAWVVLGPGLFIAGLALWLIGSSILGAIQASMLSTNWVMKVGKGGVWVQLRSYLNHAFEEPDQTALFVPFDEIEGVRRTREIRPLSPTTGRPVTSLELVLRVDTAPIAQALETEAQREGPVQRLLGVRSQTRSMHAPASLAGPGRLRLDWRGRRMLDVLAESGVRVLPAPATNAPLHDTVMVELDQEVRALLARGEKLEAIRLLRDQGHLTSQEAERLIERWSESAA